MRPSLLNRTAPKGVVDTEHHSRWPLIFLQPKFEPYLAKFSKDFWANLAPTVGTYSWHLHRLATRMDAGLW